MIIAIIIRCDINCLKFYKYFRKALIRFVGADLHWTAKSADSAAEPCDERCEAAAVVAGVAEFVGAVERAVAIVDLEFEPNVAAAPVVAE